MPIEGRECTESGACGSTWGRRPGWQAVAVLEWRREKFGGSRDCGWTGAEVCAWQWRRGGRARRRAHGNGATVDGARRCAHGNGGAVDRARRCAHGDGGAVDGRGGVRVAMVLQWTVAEAYAWQWRCRGRSRRCVRAHGAAVTRAAVCAGGGARRAPCAATDAGTRATTGAGG